MNKYPKLSIIVSTYNRANYLKECIDSIVNQNYPNLEIIVTDDNSTDNTEEVVKEYIKKYPYIKYVKNNRYKKGPTGNKNNGLDYATGELIGIFDDDDTLNEEVLLEMVEKILEGYDVVMGNCKIISSRYDNGKFSGFGISKSGEIDWKDYFCGKIWGEFWLIFKKEILGSLRFDDELYGAEGTLWRKLLKNRRIYYFHKAVRNYRIHENNISDTMIKNPSRALKNYEKDIELYENEMKKLCPKYLASLYKGAAYFAKLSRNYRKGFKYISKSILIYPTIEAFIMLIVMFLPKRIVPYLSKIRIKLKILINDKICFK